VGETKLPEEMSSKYNIRGVGKVLLVEKIVFYHGSYYKRLPTLCMKICIFHHVKIQGVLKKCCHFEKNIKVANIYSKVPD
jgi:hypothetical protein